MNFTDKEIELAKKMKDAGLEWEQEEGDFYLYKDAGPYVTHSFPIDVPNVWLPTLQQCIDKLKFCNVEPVLYVAGNQVVVPGKGMDVGETILEAMYKLLLEVIIDET